ncbi:putative glycoside hydrolase [Paenibacillus sp. GSMTC-2017]|uniref:putative glycoside hydrolase n=1 Tax=Paenibacillus sp. GSMTC-2017 TaxID=2794350 RepID=UPI0018D7D999|nr:putative glycoside hydrolase [Paenibacillus sp. GSMTC-2017]MBH5318208.1 putative glycoside hydrolase [Paenibacillus sp. GSMTC-2017]
MDIIISTFMLLYSLLTGTGEDSASAKQLAAAYLNAAAGETIVQPDSPSLTGNPTDEPGVTTTITKKDPQPDTPPIKGIYVTAHSAGGSRMDSLLKLLDETELNSMVIDIKDDNGYITYPTTTPELLEIGTAKKFIGDIDGLMTKLKSHDIYPIARIVVFKDTVLSVKKPELSFLQADGTIWKNGRGESFVNPYRQEVWDYNIALAKEAARLGFKEIQFDYVRFPEGFENKADALTFNKTEASRVDTVAGFVKYAREQLEPLGVRVSVDIFGYAASVPAAEGIGQDFVKISNDVHVISPMIYPSHYSTGWFKQKKPDRSPYATIKGAMDDTHVKLKDTGELKPIIRPWIQDFTASWLGKGNYVKYGKVEVEAQIKALHDSGVDEYLLWNAGNKYTPDVDYK